MKQKNKMSKSIFAIVLVAVLTATTATAQYCVKWDAQAARKIQARVPLLSAVVRVTDADAVAQQVRADGWHATAVSRHVMTLRASADYVRRLATDERVELIESPRTATALMADARADMEVDLLHRGDGLETPFTGKGVIVGVIDQGFEFRHIAFLDEQNRPRVVSVWNRKGYNEGIDGEPTTDIPANGDGLSVEGHACHVSNIAAGSRIGENDYCGVAPDADIIMIPSEFNESEILEDVRYIADYAHRKGQPWVINMSFGTQMGPHDGSRLLCEALDEILSEGDGRAICVAAGNDHLQPVHASHTFGNPADTVSLLLETGAYGALVDLWCSTADGERHLNVRPFIYNGGERDFKDENFWADYLIEDIDSRNQKQNIKVGLPVSTLGKTGRLGLQIVGDAGTHFHAWTNTGYGCFAQSAGEDFLDGDSRFTVDAQAACADRTITVGAYVTADHYTNAGGSVVREGYGETGQIAAFSNEGPLIDGRQKPTVSAPGSSIISAVSKYGLGFDKNGRNIVQDVHRGIKHFYYGAMSGTSMSTPQVTGTIALWLQANPHLTHEQLLDILRTTSRKDDWTGTDAWSPLYGYGKIDAYEGLKCALQLANPLSVVSVGGSSQPVTLRKEPGCWRVLFNNTEPSAYISVADVNGRILLAQQLANVSQGQEVIVDLSAFAHGTYVICIKTAQTSLTRKIICS